MNRADGNIWPPKWVRFILWPLADFNWRVNLATRLSILRFKPFRYVENENEEEFRVVPPNLARAPITVLLGPDGTVSYELELPGDERPPIASIHSCTDVFKIPLSFGRVQMKKPFVESNGRFLIVRQPNEAIYQVYTFEKGCWRRWLPREEKMGFWGTIAAGLRNYHEMGQPLLSRFATIIALLLIMFLLLGTR